MSGLGNSDDESVAEDYRGELGNSERADGRLLDRREYQNLANTAVATVAGTGESVADGTGGENRDAFGFSGENDGDTSVTFGE